MINGVFGGSALYHREPWYKPESSGSKWASSDDSSETSSHFVKSNICFANLKLIQEMEDSMECKYLIHFQFKFLLDFVYFYL